MKINIYRVLHLELYKKFIKIWEKGINFYNTCHREKRNKNACQGIEKQRNCVKMHIPFHFGQ